MRRVINRHKILAIIIVSLLSITVSSCAIKAPTGPDKPIGKIQAGESWQTIQSGQTERRYLLYVPVAYDSNTVVPLVLNFHGSGGNPVAQLAYSESKTAATPGRGHPSCSRSPGRAKPAKTL